MTQDRRRVAGQGFRRLSGRHALHGAVGPQNHRLAQTDRDDQALMDGFGTMQGQGGIHGTIVPYRGAAVAAQLIDVRAR